MNFPCTERVAAPGNVVKTDSRMSRRHCFRPPNRSAVNIVFLSLFLVHGAVEKNGFNRLRLAQDIARRFEPGVTADDPGFLTMVAACEEMRCCISSPLG